MGLPLSDASQATPSQAVTTAGMLSVVTSSVHPGVQWLLPTKVHGPCGTEKCTAVWTAAEKGDSQPGVPVPPGVA